MEQIKEKLLMYSEAQENSDPYDSSEEEDDLQIHQLLFEESSDESDYNTKEE